MLALHVHLAHIALFKEVHHALYVSLEPIMQMVEAQIFQRVYFVLVVLGREQVHHLANLVLQELI